MSIVTTGDFAKAVAPQMSGWFGSGYTRHPDIAADVFTVKSSDQAVEEDALISGTGLMLATSEGEATPYDRLKQGYVNRAMHTDYRLGIIITKNMIRDGKGLKIAEERARALGVSYVETKNTVAANVLNRAFDNTFTFGDGKELCATNHPTAAGNMSNELATAADLSEASLEQMHIEMADIRDDRGLRISLRPKALLVPRALSFEAHRILKSIGRVGTAENDTNALREMGDFGRIIVWDHLTDADAFFTLTTEDMRGLTMYMRQDLELTDDTHFDTDNAKFKAHARFAVTCIDPRHVFGSPGV